MNINLTITQANINERAKTLFDGDTYKYVTNDGIKFTVQKWDGKDFTFYHVDVNERTCYTRNEAGEKVSCPSLEKYGTCKHLLACDSTWEADAAACEQSFELYRKYALCER
jgi:hypothetical protein